MSDLLSELLDAHELGPGLPSVVVALDEDAGAIPGLDEDIPVGAYERRSRTGRLSLVHRYSRHGDPARRRFGLGRGGGSSSAVPAVSKPGDVQRGTKGPGRQPGGKAPRGSAAARGKPYGSVGTIRAARAGRKPPEQHQSELIEFDPPDKTKRALASMVTPAEAKSDKKAQPFADGDALYAQAEKDFPAYRELLNMGGGVNKRLGGTSSFIDSPAGFEQTRKTVRGAPDKPHVVIAAMKDRSKADEKVAAKYGGDYTKLADVVRATVLVPRLDDMPKALEAIRAEAAKKGWKLHAPENRFIYEQGSHVNTGPLPSGYRDFSVQLVSPQGIVAELQVNTTALWIAKDGKAGRNGHAIYEEERAIQYKATREGRALTAQERKRVEALRAEATKLYTAAFADSAMRARKRTTAASSGGRKLLR